MSHKVESGTGWVPLFAGDERTRLLQVAQEIADSMSGALSAGDYALANGGAGLALFFSYMDRCMPGRGYDDRSAEYLESAYAALESTGYSPSLYAGPLGVGFAMQHLSDRFEQDESEDVLDELDEIVLSSFEEFADVREYDLINGWVGVGVYALERLPRQEARGILKKVIDRLASLAERDADGLAWPHPKELLPGWQQPRYPQGWFNLGIAHGMPGIVAFLGECLRADVETSRCQPLLEDLLAWLRKREDQRGGHRFECMVERGQKTLPFASRDAWCYGDPGVAIALLNAAGAMNDRACRAWSIEIARDMTVRLEGTSMTDAMLCHGAAGIAHILNRFFQATRDEIFADAAKRWYERTLAMRKTGTGLAGFASYEPFTPGSSPPGTEHDSPWKTVPGILTGSAGVGLALLAAASDVEPRWDQMLLTRVPLV